MKTQSFAFESLEDLRYTLDDSDVQDNDSLLVQCFCAVPESEFIQQIQALMMTKFPQAVFVGTTTDGVIDRDDIFEGSTSLLVCTQFQQTKLVSARCNAKESLKDSFEVGYEIANKLEIDNLKVVIAFSDGLFTNGEAFVEGFSSKLPDVVLSGGMAGDNGVMKQTYVFDKTAIISQGAIGVALSSTSLRVATSYNFDWLPIGKYMEVTKSIENRVYEIDGIPAVDVYAKYMGHDLAQRLPQIGIEFPLVMEKDGMLVGRAVLAKHDDGSLTFAGNIEEGSVVRFAIGDVETILHSSSYRMHKFFQQNKCMPETVFIYSCMARRRFLQKYAVAELDGFEKMSGIAGFFTYGEFFHDQQANRLFNQTMTLLVLSEKCETGRFGSTLWSEPHRHTFSLNTQHVLSHLANSVSRELAELNESLEQRVKEAEERIYKQAYVDELTGLPNRGSLIRRLNKTIGKVLFLINIDDFTTINDFYGHKIGDEVLRRIAEKLQTFAYKTKAEVFKLPSDEFAIILDIAHTQETIQTYIDYIISLVSLEPYEIEGSIVYLNITVASSIVNEDKTGLVNADMALKMAKKDGKHFLIFHEDLKLAQQYEHNITIANKLKYALENDGIIPYFQPIYDATTLEIVKYEALVRLRDQEGSVISPYAFLDVSEKIKVYEMITRTMIEKTFRFCAQKKVNFSINLAFSDISNANIREYVFKKIQEYDIASQLTIEILETQALEDEEVILEFAHQIYRHGAKVAIDDFGSGFANFEYMTKVECDIMKIDGSLIKNIDKDKNAYLITETIVSFAKKLGKKTVAEFVHSKEVYEVVKSLDIDYVQGYYFSEPKAEI